MLPLRPSLASRFAGHFPDALRTKSICDPEDARLVAATRRGDNTAFESLVRKYQDRLCTALYLFCGSRDDAQEAAQEAFLRVYQKLDHFNGASAFYSWLFRIALNAAISGQRRKMTPRRFECWRSRHSEQLDGRRQAPDQRMLSVERVEMVQKALASLSAEHRMILVLREIDNCEYEEIARLLNIPVGTVRSRLHRARLLLRETLLSQTLS
jgi:RNA polymerase sigma-70 factor (ECF subfamily)